MRCGTGLRAGPGAHVGVVVRLRLDECGVLVFAKSGTVQSLDAHSSSASSTDVPLFMQF